MEATTFDVTVMRAMCSTPQMAVWDADILQTACDTMYVGEIDVLVPRPRAHSFRLVCL